MAAARNRFFAALPTDELTPVEQTLRKALLKAVQSNNGHFPLIQWIDRRIGGEIETKRDETGAFEIMERGAAPARGAAENSRPAESKEAFFASLSPDSFSQAEEALRDGIFEFLASWRSQDLATLTDLSGFAEVQRRRQAFLPRNVTLRDWIEHRIGGEIEFRAGRNGKEVVHLTESAKATVMAKFQQIASRGPPAMGPGMGGPGMMPGHHAAPPPPAGPPPAGASARVPVVVDKVDKDTFFANLPTDELLPTEVALRQAMLDWLKRWPATRPANRAPNSAPHLADTGHDAEIRRCKADLLPPKVRLVDWIERRIGGEVDLRPLPNGQHEVHLRGEARGNGAQSGTTPAEAKEGFFAALPQDEFSSEEEALRAALLGFLDGWSGPNQPTLTDAGSEEQISRCRKALLPKGTPVSLKEWIDRRIGGEIETRASSKGQHIIGRRGTLDNDRPGAKRRRM